MTKPGLPAIEKAGLRSISSWAQITRYIRLVDGALGGPEETILIKLLQKSVTFQFFVMPMGLGGIVAKNFKIHKHVNSGTTRLNLKGNFDGSSAFELLNTLRKYYGDKAKIVIDTGDIASIQPFGLEVFQKNNSILKKCQGLKFIGKYAKIMANGKAIGNKCYH